MTALKQKIQKDLEDSAKNKESLRTSVLRMLLASLLNKEKEKRYKINKEKPDLSEEELQKESQLTDDEMLEVVSSEIKKRKEAISEYEKGERKDLAEKEGKEMDILQKYLPEQISEEEIRKIAEDAVKKLGAKEPKDMGKVMQEIIPQLKGRAEGALISKIVKDLLVSQ